MKKIDVVQTITILANIGVIAGIVFLAFELQQNSEWLAAEARANQFFQARVTADQLTANPELTGILYKLENREPVTGAELYQFRWFARGLFVRWQWQFDEFQRGSIDKESLPLAAWASWFTVIPEMQGEWNESAGVTPEFERLMVQEGVIEERP